MNRRSTEGPYPGTQAVRRAIRVLRSFTDDRPRWSLAPLSRELGLNKSTTYRLVTALTDEGLLTWDQKTETYRLGPEAIALGARAQRANGLRAVARPVLEELARETAETATLEVLVASEVLILDEVAGRHLLGSGMEVGLRWPAHATATGKVLLAAASRQDRRLPTSLPAITGKTITEKDRFEAELEKVRKRGWAQNVEELERGFAAVAAPVWDSADRVVAAVSVGGPLVRLRDGNFRPVVEAVCAAARRLSALLGGRGEEARR